MTPKEISVDFVKAADLDGDIENAWRAIRAGNDMLASPFFHAGFTRALAAHRDDVRVAVASRGGDITAVLPFHARPRGVAAPIGGPMSDFQGLIAGNDADVDFADFLKRAGLAAYDFNHGLAAQAPLAAGAYLFTDSPAIDLSAGFNGWLENRKSAGVSDIKNTERKARKLAREHGDLRFAPDDRNPSAWETFINWKTEALSALGVTPFTEIPWMHGTLQTLRKANGDEFSGVLNCLYVGDQLAAAHFGLRAGAVWHWWFPTYDPALSRYSPGLILLYELARYASGDRPAKIDLGRGDERYKTSFANASTEICEGAVAVPASTAGMLRRARISAQRITNNVAPARFADIARRGGNRLLGACRLP